MRLLLAATALLLVVSASDVRAGSCPGPSPFTDVPQGSIFCSEALWLRNAMVTLGCGNGTTYCPSDFVTRAQMALFMKRLARLATPDVVHAAVPSSSGDIDAGFGACLTGTYSIPATGANIRTLLQAIGNYSVLTNGNGADILVSIQMRTNGGAFVILGGTFSRAVVPAGQWTTVPILWSQTLTSGSGFPLVPGSTYEWQVGLQRASFATTGEVTDLRCQLTVTLPMDASFL